MIIEPPRIQSWEMTIVGFVQKGSTVQSGAGRWRKRRTRLTSPSLGLRIQIQR